MCSILLQMKWRGVCIKDLYCSSRHLQSTHRPVISAHHPTPRPMRDGRWPGECPTRSRVGSWWPVVYGTRLTTTACRAITKLCRIRTRSTPLTRQPQCIIVLTRPASARAWWAAGREVTCPTVTYRSWTTAAVAQCPRRLTWTAPTHRAQCPSLSAPRPREDTTN